MRIIRIIGTTNPRAGGTVSAMSHVNRSLVEMGHTVEVASLDRPGSAWIRDDTVPVHALGPGLGKYGYSPRLVPWLVENSSRFDAVIVDGIWRYSSFGVWRALRGKGTPYFVYPHGMLDPWFKRRYPLKHLKKLLYWPWAEYRVLRDARAVLFTTEEERTDARESFRLYKCTERIVPPGIASPPEVSDTAREEFFRLYPETRGKRIALYLGRLHEKKGVDILVRAFGDLRVWMGSAGECLHLVMAGPCADDVQLRRLKALSAKCMSVGSEAVTWTGMLEGSMKWGALDVAEIFALPSHQENFGIAVVEAMATGTPVMITDKVNICGRIAAAGAGLVDSDDPEGVRRMLDTWVARTGEDWSAAGARARELFESEFESGRAAAVLAGVLGEYCGS